ncbi:MAG: ThuA domain-containing protein [Gammaproteobacteria bacterium]|nr:Crp/Fnr family transcriptional regulator [Gammaproteobacteria bacterium]
MHRFRAWLLCILACGWSSSSIAQQFDVLLFTKTDGWHHESINAAVSAIEHLGKKHHFNVVWTENASLVFNDKALAQFEVVVFLLTTGDVLNDEQQAAFERYIRSGRGFVGVHSAADTEYEWEWYTRMVGHMFVRHPPVQTATVKVEDPDFPGMDRFAPRFLFTDEWYEFDAARSQNLRYLLSLDESTYEPTAARRKESSRFHPLSWYQEYDGGRAFYTALGHLPATYSDESFLHHLYGGIYWAATGRGFKSR